MERDMIRGSMVSSAPIATRSLYPSASEVERTFRFLSELEKEEASYMSMSLESLSQSNKIERSSLNDHSMSFYDSARTIALSSQESMNEYSTSGPLSSKLDTDEKSKIRNFLQDSADLFTGGYQDQPQTDHMLYPVLNRAVTDQPMQKKPIFFPEFSKDSNPGGPLFLPATNSSDPPPFHSIDIPQFNQESSIDIKESNRNTHRTRRNDGNMNVNFSFKPPDAEVLDEERPLAQQKQHQHQSIGLSSRQGRLNEPRSYEPENLRLHQLSISEDSTESPEGIQKESNLRLIYHRHSDPLLSSSRVHGISSKEDSRSDKLKRSVSDGEQKNYKRDFSRNWQYISKKPFDFNKRSSVTKNREQGAKHESDLMNAITCLGCMRMLVGRKSAKLVSCPVCRVVTPNKIN